MIIPDESAAYGDLPENIAWVSPNMLSTFIKDCARHLLNARSTFDLFHALWHANAELGRLRLSDEP